MIALFKQQWFLLLLVAILAGGMSAPALLEPVADAIPRGGVVAVVLFLMSFTLAGDAMWRAVSRPGPALLATAINAALAPPVAWLLSRLLPPGDLAVGLIVASTVPCTLASAAVWTRRAAGNDAVALLVTMVTNLFCFAIVPGWLSLLVGSQMTIDFSGLVLRLVMLAVLPIVLGQLLRRVAPLAKFADRRKLLLGVIAQCGLLAIVLQGAVGSGQSIAQTQGVLTIGVVAAMFTAVIALHLVLFATGLLTSRACRFAPADSSAVAIAGSQKTLMIGVDVALLLGGLTILPMVAYHAAQLIIDTLLADWLRRRQEKST